MRGTLTDLCTFCNENDIIFYFCSGHFSFAWYCLYYLHSMSKLPGPLQNGITKGNHVVGHKRDIWSGLWSDQYIESTFMRYGHSPGGIVGITLQPSTVKWWAVSLNICAQLKKDVMSLSDVIYRPQAQPIRRRVLQGTWLIPQTERRLGTSL